MQNILKSIMSSIKPTDALTKLIFLKVIYITYEKLKAGWINC